MTARVVRIAHQILHQNRVEAISCLQQWEELPPHTRRENWMEMSRDTRCKIIKAMIWRRDIRMSKSNYLDEDFHG